MTTAHRIKTAHVVFFAAFRMHARGLVAAAQVVGHHENDQIRFRRRILPHEDHHFTLPGPQTHRGIIHPEQRSAQTRIVVVESHRHTRRDGLLAAIGHGGIENNAGPADITPSPQAPGRQIRRIKEPPALYVLAEVIQIRVVPIGRPSSITLVTE